MDLLELIQRDIDEIAQWGHCNFAETFKTLVLAKKEIETLRSKVNNGVLDDVSNTEGKLEAVEDLKEFARNNCREWNFEELEEIISRL